MLGRGRSSVKWPAAGALLLLGACSSSLAPEYTYVTPQVRPAAVPVSATPYGRDTSAEPSAKSREIAAYYRRLEADLLARGLLRVDGGGPDTVFTDTMLGARFPRNCVKGRTPASARIAKGIGFPVQRDQEMAAARASGCGIRRFCFCGTSAQGS